MANNTYCPFGSCAIGNSLTITSNVTTIPNYLFGSSGLTHLTLPSSVTTIGASAFYQCTGITSLTLPSSVTVIDSYAFYGCSIASLTLDHAMDLGNECFKGSTGIVVTLDANVTTTRVGNNTYCPFESCAIGEGLTITSNVTTIPTYLFGSSGLTNLVLPSSVIVINDYAFNNCSIDSLTLDHPIDLGSECFYGNTGIVVVLDANVTTTRVDSSSVCPFESCAIGEGLTITSNVTTIPDYLFGSSGLTALAIPSSVTTIYKHAFRQCTNLISLTLPSSVTIIDDYAFSGCSIDSLLLDHPIDLGSECFYGNTGIVVVLDANVTTTRVDSSSVCPFESCAIGEGLTITSNVTTIPNYLFGYSGGTVNI